MNWNALSDDELIARYQAGEETALKTIILRYQRRLFSYILVSVKNKEEPNRRRGRSEKYGILL